MNRRRPAFRPQAVDLEPRLALSLATVPVAEVASPRADDDPIMTTMAAPQALTGRYSAAGDDRAADAPLHVRVGGTGQVAGIGRGRAVGALDLGGFRVTGAADVTGTLTVHTGRGAAKLTLTGSGGFDAVPNGDFTTTIAAVQGRGSLANSLRAGTVTFHFGANQVRSHRSPGPIGGAVTITINPATAAS